jgi:hypothetical protein
LGNDKIIRLEDLCAATGLKTKEDVMEDAINFYNWAIEAIQAGKLVGEKRIDGEFVQVLTLGLDHVRSGYRKTWDDLTGMEA